MSETYKRYGEARVTFEFEGMQIEARRPADGSIVILTPREINADEYNRMYRAVEKVFSTMDQHLRLNMVKI